MVLVLGIRFFRPKWLGNDQKSNIFGNYRQTNQSLPKKMNCTGVFSVVGTIAPPIALFFRNFLYWNHQAIFGGTWRLKPREEKRISDDYRTCKWRNRLKIWASNLLSSVDTDMSVLFLQDTRTSHLQFPVLNCSITAEPLKRKLTGDLHAFVKKQVWTLKLRRMNDTSVFSSTKITALPVYCPIRQPSIYSLCWIQPELATGIRIKSHLKTLFGWEVKKKQLVSSFSS